MTHTPAPLPTRPPFEKRETSRPQSIMHMGGTILSIDIAVHPSMGWPAVVAVEASLTTMDKPHVFVRTYNPVTRRWGSTQSIGSQGTALFSRFRTAQIAISADNTIHLVWGPGQIPKLGLYAIESHDYGESWSSPRVIAHQSYGVFDIAAAADGSVFVLANSEAKQHPLIIRRSSQGQWQPPEVLAMPSWYGSTGALSIAGEGQQANITLVTTGGGGSSTDNSLFSAQRKGPNGLWNLEHHLVKTDKIDLLTHVRAIPLPDGTLFTFAMDAHNNVYALRIRNGQRQPIMQVVQGSGQQTPYIAAAYDPIKQRSFVLWTCCANASFVAAESTHYARWNTSNNDVWYPQKATPILTGAISAADLASAQANNSHQVWLAWAESVHDGMVPSFDLALLTP